LNFKVTRAIAKIEIYNPISDSFYCVPPERAMELARNNPHKWVGNKRLILGADRTVRVTWDAVQSGFDGPIVMQVVT
jgi:hypothetical protein